MGYRAAMITTGAASFYIHLMLLKKRIVDMPFTKIMLFMLTFPLFFNQSRAQDPKLPPTNLGLSNMQDGNPPGTGWYFQYFLQNDQALSNRGASGENLPGEKISSLLSMSQLIYISKYNFAGGNPGFTLLLPVVRISGPNNQASGPSINPNPLGDVIAGPFIQWFNKRLFNMKFSHRFEFDVTIPSGSYEQAYAINPGSHLFSLTPHYTFTIFPTEKFSISMRHHLNYYFKQIGTPVRSGISYNFNYAAEYSLTTAIRVEIAGYYLKQLEQDSYDGNPQYYQDNYPIADTKEKVFAYGPGVGYVTPSGLFFELKGMSESDAENRSQGFRTTLVVAYKLDR
jgi:hypothetical protein